MSSKKILPFSLQGSQLQASQYSVNKNLTLNNDPKQMTTLNSREIEIKPSDLSDLFVKRKQNIAWYCEFKKTLTNKTLTNDQMFNWNTQFLLVLKDRNLAWCPVFKAGSSTWLTILLDLSSVSAVSLYFEEMITATV